MNKDDLNSFFLDKESGDIYKMIAYCDQPTVTLVKVADGQRIDFTVNSYMAREFVKLIPENENED